MKKIVEELMYMFGEELQKVYDREVAEADYLAQDDYDSCLDRATAGINEAAKKVILTAAVSIANHREVKHKEDHSEELNFLATQVDYKAADGPEYWNA